MCIFKKPKADRSANRFYEQQNQEQARRRAEQEAAVAKINASFANGAREPIYQQGFQAYFDKLTGDARDQYEQAISGGKTALARRGQLGGSVDAGYFTKAKKLFDNALLKADSMAQQFRTDAKAQDEQLRGQLVSQAYGGLTGSAAQELTAAQLAASGNNFLARARDATIGDVFSDLATNLGQARQTAAVTRALNPRGDEFTTYFGGGGSYAGAT